MSDDQDYEDGGWVHGCVFWSELQTHDIAGARKFYEETLGLHFEPTKVGEMTYWMILTADDETVGGAFEMKAPEMADIPERWMTFLSVDDVDARVKKAAAAGATILREPFDVPEVGRIAILRQPGGGAIGWITPAEEDEEVV